LIAPGPSDVARRLHEGRLEVPVAKRGRSTQDGDQSSSGVGADDRDRQGQRVQDPESPWARGEDRSPPPAPNRNTGSGPRADKSGRGSQVDTGDRSSRGENSRGQKTRSGSRSNRKK
jgi:hypothetical protein